jgi:hypothetical protein
MKKTLSFLFVALPLGLLLSLILAVILGTVTFCRSFADYWSYIIVQFFPMYGMRDRVEEEQEPQEPQEQSSIWEKHQAKMDAKKREEPKD